MDLPATQDTIAAFREDKLRALEEACKVQDLEVLAALATSSLGLVSDEVRQNACKFVSP